ncbi:bacteriocin immunity protein [Clostridium perfringens]|uniref:Putative immunity protein n=1 Tax=Clostridium perfringens (strain SM101 / Type A) TaxID=289380 RepID=Q0SWD4_CLOPS|nr:bacteriocin immunity protein [Clostridium perfringens]ABG86114.1 putative immunity protein [Clostridium perfringens SM101]EJT5925736.1 bacteriocin immunity protein [Clostridium perfringens]MDG6880305.1 Enterocin A Immunity [Clostridium perfringens]MDH5061496.1 Enterocin A Immunity [Clostridium perfringens NCTC 8239]MDM0452536.1 bacteriocin immunity protein [Clostridium perfringens]
MENGELMNRSKDLVHSLYNSLSKSKENNFDDIKEVLLKVYTKLDLCDEKNIPLINRLVNYIYFTAYTKKLTFSSNEENIIRELSDIGKYAGLNGVYRSDYGDKSQF